MVLPLACRMGEDVPMADFESITSSTGKKFMAFQSDLTPHQKQGFVPKRHFWRTAEPSDRKGTRLGAEEPLRLSSYAGWPFWSLLEEPWLPHI